MNGVSVQPKISYTQTVVKPEHFTSDIASVLRSSESPQEKAKKLAESINKARTSKKETISVTQSKKPKRNFTTPSPQCASLINDLVKIQTIQKQMRVERQKSSARLRQCQERVGSWMSHNNRDKMKITMSNNSLSGGGDGHNKFSLKMYESKAQKKISKKMLYELILKVLQENNNVRNPEIFQEKLLNLIKKQQVVSRKTHVFKNGSKLVATS